MFMVVERFKDGDPRPVYRRLRSEGRLASEGLYYRGSWVDRRLERCFQLMETEDRALLDAWIDRWSDLVDFEVIEVMSSEEASALIDSAPGDG